MDITFAVRGRWVVEHIDTGMIPTAIITVRVTKAPKRKHARVIAQALTKLLNDQMQAVRQEAYLAGYADHEDAFPKRRLFSSKVNTINGFIGC